LKGHRRVLRKDIGRKESKGGKGREKNRQASRNGRNEIKVRVAKERKTCLMADTCVDGERILFPQILTPICRKKGVNTGEPTEK
jgi:hypothetical protein